MRKRNPSIRATLLVYLGILFVAGAALLFAAVRSYGRSTADLSYDRLLTASALSIAENVGIVQGNWHVDLPYAALDVLAQAQNDRVFYRVAAPDGKTITGYDDLPLLFRSTEESMFFFDATYRGEPMRFIVLRRWIARPVDPGWAFVQVGQTREARNAFANDITFRALLPIVLLTLVALPLLWFGVDRALRPLASIERDLMNREPSDLRPVSGAVPIELAHLVGALNGFMARLASNVAVLRTFIADAAHQMRTPLASLRAQAQLAIDEKDPAEQRRSLLLVETNAGRLSRLLDQLLSDAIVTHRSDLRHFEPLDLVQGIREAIREIMPRAEPQPELRFQYDSAHAPMSGDRVMLSEAIKNLISNALLHGMPERGPIDIRLRREGALYIIEIADRGPGIPVHERERVFERFHRGDEPPATRGSGLGLPIVKRVLDAHNGTIALKDRPGGGLLVRIELPTGERA
jgi:two-component system sensor histidine kinase TctE